MKRRNARLLPIVCASLLGGAGAAHAIDGVIEINNASVIAAGGYPAVIPTPGSYVLTGNLTPPPGSIGVSVIAPDVTLDLNGFRILGAGGGVTDGIQAFPVGFTVRNGSVSGFSGVGINTGSGSKIFQVHVSSNGLGISANSCLILESVIETNTGNGVGADRCKVENNIIQGNSGVGLTGGSNVIVNNRIEGNAGGGILTFGGSTIQENIISMNPVFGVSDGVFGPPPPPPPPPFPSRVDVRGNVIDGSGGPGISFIIPALIVDNTISGSTGSGIACGSACTVQANLIVSNNVGLLPGSGGAVVAAGSNVTLNSISYNGGFGLLTPLTAGYSQNTFQANGPGGLGPNVLSPPHPTAGFMNLCNGIAGPAPTCP